MMLDFLKINELKKPNSICHITGNYLIFFKKIKQQGNQNKVVDCLGEALAVACFK